MEMSLKRPRAKTLYNRNQPNDLLAPVSGPKLGLIWALAHETNGSIVIRYVRSFCVFSFCELYKPCILLV